MESLIVTMTIEEIVQFAKDVESADPIDWGMLPVDEETVYPLLASSIVQHIRELPKDEAYDLMVVSTIINLVVENFVLNMKLQKQHD